jgi:hypothetical protein
MDECARLCELLNNNSKTQLMRQDIDLIALKYYKTAELFLIHSYYEKTGSRFARHLFSAPAVLSDIKIANGTSTLTVKSLKDEFDKEAVSLIRQMKPGEVETAYSHILPDFLEPKLKNDEWDNWTFAYSLSPEEKLIRRIERNRSKAANLCRNFKASDFENKYLLFLGCGDGDEIQTFIDYYGLKNARILGIDQSKAAIKNCENVKKRFPKMQIEFRKMEFDCIEECENENFDFIFSIGIFDRETLNFNYACRLLGEIKEKLKFESLITSAYTFELFSKKNYEDLGFDVLKTCLPSALYTHDYSFFYHLKKTGNKPINIFDTTAEESRAYYV